MDATAAPDNRILIVDDDPHFVAAVAEALTDAGYRVDMAASGQDALVRVLQSHPHLVLLDLGLPDIGGMEVFQLLHQHLANVPVIFLTARHMSRDIVAGLDAGADDYITKPCTHVELLARVRAVLRRPRTATTSVPVEYIVVGDVTIDAGRHQVAVRGEQVELSPKEFNLLWLLMANAGHVVPRMHIIDAVWGSDFYGDVKALDVYIRALRRKIETEPDHPQLIETVRGVGYRFAAADTALPV